MFGWGVILQEMALNGTRKDLGEKLVFQRTLEPRPTFLQLRIGG
jgi:hypothetical protein